MSQTQAVIELLRDLNAAHEELIEIENLKTKALTRNDTDELVKHIQRQTKLVKKVSDLEQRRMDQTRRWFEQNDFDEERFTLNDLIQMTPNYREKEELSRLREQLREQVDELRRLNELNEQLIEQSLSYIQFSLRLFARDPHENITYGRNKEHEIAPSVRSGFFDSRA